MKEKLEFNGILTVNRRRCDGNNETFTTGCLSRIELAVDFDADNKAVTKCLFLVSPEKKLLPGDIVDDGNGQVRLGKVSELRNIDGELQGYRAESV